jgi:hypothetical protein
MSGGSAGGMSGGSAGGMSGGSAGGMSGGSAGGVSGGSAGGLSSDGGMTPGTDWGTTFDAGGLRLPDGGLLCSANPRVRRLFTAESDVSVVHVAVRDGGLSVQLLNILDRSRFNEARLTLTGLDAGLRSFTGTFNALATAQRAYEPASGFEAFSWSPGIDLGTPAASAFRVLTPAWTGAPAVSASLTTKHGGVAVVLNPVQREWATFTVYRPTTFDPDVLSMTRRSLDGGLLSVTVPVDGGVVWSSFPLSSFVWTGNEFFAASTQAIFRIPPDGGVGTRLAEVPWASTLVLAPAESEVGVMIRARDGGLFFNRVSPDGQWQQPVATMVSPVAVRPIPAMVWDGRRFRLGFNDVATSQPWTAAVSRLGVLEAVEPLGCAPGVVWNEPRFAVVDAGFAVSTFVTPTESGVVQVP